MKTIFLFLNIIFFLSAGEVMSQKKNAILRYLKHFKVSGYVETYYAYDTDKDKSQRQFAAFCPFRDEFRLNIAQVTVKYDSKKVRGNVTLQVGDIPRVNWLSYNPIIQEANIGFSPYKSLWVDAGYFLTHIGAETLPKNSYLSSYAMMTYYEPLYQSGVKVAYDFSSQFGACLHLLNGYNVIEDNNKNKSFGVQLYYSPCPEYRISYNNIIGNEIPSGSEGKLRILNDLVITAAPHEKVDVIAGVDYSVQEKSKLFEPDKSATSFGVLGIVRYKVSKKFSITARGEYYSDPDGVYSGVLPDGRGIKAAGATIGLEYRPVENAFVRFESRYLKLDDAQKVFFDNKNNRTEASISAGFEF